MQIDEPWLLHHGYRPSVFRGRAKADRNEPLLRKVIETYSHAPKHRAQLAAHLAQTGRFDEVEGLAKVGLEQAPGDPWTKMFAYDALARLERHRGNVEAATRLESLAAENRGQEMGASALVSRFRGVA